MSFSPLYREISPLTKQEWKLPPLLEKPFEKSTFCPFLLNTKKFFRQLICIQIGHIWLFERYFKYPHQKKISQNTIYRVLITYIQLNFFLYIFYFLDYQIFIGGKSMGIVVKYAMSIFDFSVLNWHKNIYKLSSIARIIESVAKLENTLYFEYCIILVYIVRYCTNLKTPCSLKTASFSG